MDLAKISSPGCMNLSPVCRPAIESTIAVSRCLIPVMLIEPMLYSLGIRALCHSNNFGSTDLGSVGSGYAGLLVSCAYNVDKDRTTISAVMEIRKSLLKGM